MWFSLTTICHDSGMRAIHRTHPDETHSQEVYCAAYYATLRKLVPGHPALAQYERALAEEEETMRCQP